MSVDPFHAKMKYIELELGIKNATSYSIFKFPKFMLKIIGIHLIDITSLLGAKQRGI